MWITYFVLFPIPTYPYTAYINHLMGQKRTGSKKGHPVVVIETNKKNDLAVVQLTTKPGANKTRLKNYQQGQSYFKHFIEIEDDEGKPIRVNEKFKENHPNMDVSTKDVNRIKDTVLNHSKQSQENRKQIERFRQK